MMKMNKKISISCFTFLVLLSGSVKAQQSLSLSDALGMALKYNYDILLASKQTETAKVNNSAGNAGMLPTLELTGTGTFTDNNTKIVQSTGAEKSYTGLITKTLNGGVQLNWTLYDGGKMFVSKRKLTEIQSQGEASFREQVMQTMYDVTAAYFDVVRQKQQLLAMQEVRKFNNEQVVIAGAGFAAGKLAKTDLLQAKIDLNVTDESIINQQYTIVAAQKKLKLLLGKTNSDVFNVTDTIAVSYQPDRAALTEKLLQQNPSLSALKHQIAAADLALKESKSAYLPNFSLRAGYYASYTENPIGFTTSNRALGPQVSGTVSVPLYNAGETKRQTTLARIETESARYAMESMKQDLNVAMENTLTDFQNQQTLLNLESENNALARENMEISVERLRLGQTTSLEVHQASEYYVQSSTRLTNFRYNLKLAEIRLKQLAGEL